MFNIEINDLIGFFGTLPVEAVEHDGFWKFRVEDRVGMFLEVSIDIFQASIDVKIYYDNNLVTLLNLENCESVKYENIQDQQKMFIKFTLQESLSELEIAIFPNIKVSYYRITR